MKHGCDLKLVNKHRYVAFNGHLWVVSDYVCKRCGRKDYEVADFNKGICVFDEKRNKLEEKMKERLKEVVKEYEEGCKKLMKEVSEVIKKRWEESGDKNQRNFDHLEAEAFKSVCKMKSYPLRNFLKEKV